MDHTDRRLPAQWAPWVAAGLLVVTLLLAYAGKAVCLEGESGFWGMTRYCYSDVRVLWSFRGFDVDAVPYASAPEGYVEDYTLEYPPGLTFPAWLIAVVTDSRRGFFDLHALTFAVAAFVALFQLDRALVEMGRSRWRTLGFALSPGLVLFGLQNWDLWAVALVALGLAAAARRRPVPAAVWFGLGAAVKWWPALLVVPLLVGPWAPPDLRQRWRPAAAAAGTWLLVQVPALVISPGRWLDSITFHLGRGANLDSFGAALAAAGEAVAPGRFWQGPFTSLLTLVTLAVLAAGAVVVARRLHRGTLDPGDACLALVALFLFTGKVFSPQFILWLLPVAIVSSVSWTPVLAVESANAVVWLLFGPWMGNLDDPAFGGFLHAAQGATVVRAGALAWVVGAALLAGERGRGSTGREDPDQQERQRAQGVEQAQVAWTRVHRE